MAIPPPRPALAPPSTGARWRPGRSLVAALTLLATATTATATGPALAAAPQVPFPGINVIAPQVPAGSRQVTVFGILATPNDRTLDPKLQPIAPQLRRLFPNHGFRLLGTETGRLASGETLACPLAAGLALQTQLVTPLDANGKVQLRVQLDRDGQLDFATVVTTPLNQLFFCDKPLPDGTRVILGIGARE